MLGNTCDRASHNVERVEGMRLPIDVQPCQVKRKAALYYAEPSKERGGENNSGGSAVHKILEYRYTPNRHAFFINWKTGCSEIPLAKD